MHSKDKIQMILAMVIFGTIGIVRKYIPLPSSVIALSRGIIGTVFLLALHFCRKERFSKRALKRNLPLLLASGILLGGNWILLFEAYRFTSVSAATMAYYMAPVFVILASPLLLHEKITLRKGLCSLTAVVGMVLVSGILQSETSGFIGILLGLCAAVMYAAVIVLNKFIKDLSANERTIFQLAVSAIAILPYVICTENLSTLQIDTTTIALLITSGIVHTGIAYALYFGSMKTLPAQTIALFSYIDPITAVILSITVLNEEISLLSLLGVVLVIGSMLISELKINAKNNN